MEPDALSISDILVALGAIRPAVSRNDVMMGRQWAARYATVYEPKEVTLD